MQANWTKWKTFFKSETESKKNKENICKRNFLSLIPKTLNVRKIITNKIFKKQIFKEFFIENKTANLRN